MPVCPVCPHHCQLQEAQVGLCRARVAQTGQVVALHPEVCSALALDPIEKKPLLAFYPGRMILSVGGYGCNMRCSFCQNADISFVPIPAQSQKNLLLTAQDIVMEALALQSQRNIGIAFTYNEPLLRYEYIAECFTLAKEAGLKTVLVTNGNFCAAVIEKLVPLTDAWNIDLKSFTDVGYKSLGGDLETVKDTIKTASQTAHVEVCSLIVPGLNDRAEDMDEQAQWLASVKPEIVLHLTRFFPRHKMRTKQPTELNVMRELQKIAANYLPKVVLGNV